ncbi:MAG: GAF domain-containing protein [Anaerolineae bacterium]
MATASTADNTPTFNPFLVGQSRTATQRLMLGAALGITALCLLLLIAYLWLAVNWAISPFFGATFSHTMVVAAGEPSGDEGWMGLAAGLQRGDQLLAVHYCPPGGECIQTGDCTEDVCDSADWSANPANYTAAQNLFDYFMDQRSAGDEVQVSFLRAADARVENPGALCEPLEDNSAMLRCTTQYALQRFPNGDFLAFFIVPYITAFFVAVIGLVILRLRLNQPIAMLTACTFMLLAVSIAGVSDNGFTHRFGWAWLIAIPLASSGFATLALIFPTRMTVIYRQPMAVYVPLAIGILLAAIFVYLYFYPTDLMNAGVSAQAASITILLGMGMFAQSAFRQRRSAQTTMIRDQSNAIWVGFVMMVAPAALWIATRAIQALLPNTYLELPFGVETAMPFALAPVLSITYAVLQYRKWDTDRLISQGIAYGIMLVALIMGFFLMVFGVSLLTNSVAKPTDPLLVALTIFIVSVGFLPIRTYLQKRIDEIYFRTRRNYQEQIERFGQKLTQLVDLPRINNEFRSLVESTLMPSNIFIFLPNFETKEYAAYGDPKPETDIHFTADSGVITLLHRTSDPIYLAQGQPWNDELRSERARFNLLKTAILAGLPGQEQLNGFVSIGAPRSGQRGYNFEELRFISSLTSQMAVAVERTQVIASLRRRVSELDVLSKVSQAVNFTIEFDALLELISAQTNKLIEASYFYIVLRDQVANQLYFAFFVEDDVRYAEKENKRWAIGRDLYSEIVTGAKAMRVDNYALALAARNAPVLFMSEDVKAWMGVPLIAGPRVLGVIALGTVENAKTFTEEQLKIFSDIGALAATSLDKARLFAETEVRARQLSVLNEISQRLVAAELNVERLLELITSSAVDILGGEAGSLFLMADDGSGDLEFKVVIGGSGKELLGSRVPAGRGLVGEVAKKGKPAIVNDTRQDPRFQGEVSKTGQFRTSSILAVPLIAKNKVIGVLEVLNRKDGGVYTEEDTALLSTFAGQAAVAIENARLFEVTDIQLGKRIQELEALERIDVELNRTLDLKKVAEIALRWAIAQTGATAGVIGQIVGEPAVMQILAMYGYRDSDHPQGAEGKIWPVDKGIVSRVIRTRQADLATDTSIDPDYIPSLSAARSQITLPMMSGGELSALMVLESDKKERLSLLDLQFAQRLAEHASVAMENARLTAELNLTLQSKSEFMGFAAHELKNPLTSIKGFASISPQMFAAMPDENKQEIIGVIRRNADRMETIINDLRDAAKAEAGQLNIQLEAISIRNVVVETLRPFYRQLEDKLQEVIIEVPETLPMVLGDQTRLIQVLTNLVSNAHKYSPPESTITISAKVIADNDALLQERNKNRKQKVKYSGPYMYCTVADTGIGLSDDDLRRLFRERYFRSDDKRAQDQPGTGLGMMITQTIIQLHHGEIWVTSQLDVGTTFHFIVPLAPERELASD